MRIRPALALIALFPLVTTGCATTKIPKAMGWTHMTLAPGGPTVDLDVDPCADGRCTSTKEIDSKAEVKCDKGPGNTLVNCRTKLKKK